MDQTKKEKLESQGWQVGTTTEFLNLTSEDLLIIEIKLALARRLEERQKESALSATNKQPTLTTSEQPASIDQLIRDIVAAGASPQEIGQLIASIDIAAVA